jgi:hypothetical protein
MWDILLIEHPEFNPGKAGQAFLGSHPQVTVPGLDYGINGNLGQAVFNTPDIQYIMGNVLIGIQGKDEKRQHKYTALKYSYEPCPETIFFTSIHFSHSIPKKNIFATVSLSHRGASPPAAFRIYLCGMSFSLLFNRAFARK